MTSPFSATACAHALSDPDTLGTVLYAIALSTFGEEVFTGSDEEPPADMVVIFNELETVYGVRLPLEAESRLFAVQMLTTTEAFHREPAAFVAICKALALGQTPDPVSGAFSDLTPFEILHGLYEADVILGDQAPELQAAVAALIAREFQESPEDLAEMVTSPLENSVLESAEILREQMRQLGVSETLLEQI
jgi:hypothetical protein